MLISIKCCKECGKPISGKQYGSLGSSILHQVKCIKVNKLCKQCRNYGKVKETECVPLFHYSPITKPRSIKPKIKMAEDKKRIGLRGRSAIIVRALSAAGYQKGLKDSRKT